MTWREITPANFNAFKNTLVIDVRSPCEHAAERIPNSINVPLLSDDERAEVGTIYKQQSEMVARRHALKLIAPKIPSILDTVTELRQHGQATVIYCWRGGLRSEAFSSVLSIAGLDCFRLTGGYKAWRAQVLADFEADSYPFQPVVVQGLTGVGKTEILNGLAAAGHQVLDLERIANHRGSVFGGLGLGDQPTQKNFDALLWMQLRELGPGVVFVEAESRKVGNLRLPDCVFNRIRSGPSILVQGSVEKRAERIAADYLSPRNDSDAVGAHSSAARNSEHVVETGGTGVRPYAEGVESELRHGLELLSHLKDRLGCKMVAQIQDMVAKGDILEAVKVLLVEYYDPLYSRHFERTKSFVLEVNGDDVDGAVRSIAAWSAAQNRREMTMPQV